MTAPAQLASEILRIKDNAAIARNTANYSAELNDDTGICEALAALTDAVLLLVQVQAEATA